MVGAKRKEKVQGKEKERKEEKSGGHEPPIEVSVWRRVWGRREGWRRGGHFMVAALVTI